MWPFGQTGLSSRRQNERQGMCIFRRRLTKTESKEKLNGVMPQVRAENAMDCHGASKKIPGHSIFFVVHLLYVRYWTRQQASLLPALLYHLRNYITTLFALAKWWSILRMHLWNIKFKITVESEMGRLSRCHLATETSLERVCRACCWCEHKHRF